MRLAAMLGPNSYQQKCTVREGCRARSAMTNFLTGIRMKDAEFAHLCPIGMASGSGVATPEELESSTC